MAQLINQWIFCLRQFVLMSVFASGPDRLPYRLDCLIVTILAYCLLGFSLVDDQQSYGTIFIQILLELSLLALICYLGLKLARKLPRFAQCFTALVGINFVISAISIPLVNWLTAGSTTENGVSGSLLYLGMLMVFWNLAVMSQILKKTFEINTVMSAVIAFNYFLAYQFLIIWLY